MSIEKGLVSIILRNRNEAKHLPFVLGAIKQQSYQQYEIIFIDNESTDNSIEIAKQFGAKVFTISKADFSYGRAINFGIQNSNGEFCLILSAHSVMMGTYFFQDSLAPFLRDEKIAAVRICLAGKEVDYKNMLKPVIVDNPNDISAITSNGPLASGCMIRRSVWDEVKFNEEVEAAEEKLWARDAIKLGYKTFATVGATYIYTREIPDDKRLNKRFKENRTIFKETGQRNGIAKFSKSDGYKRIFFSVVVGLASAVKAMKKEIQFGQKILSFDKKVKESYHKGSNR